MLYKQNDITILLKGIIFIFGVFPFISHIYGAVFPAIYNYKIANVASAIILIVIAVAISERKINYDKNVLYFIPFLLVALAESIYSNNLYFFKYLAYVFIYFLFFRKFFFHKFIFKLYVNILVITFLILFSIFLITLNTDFDIFSYFRVSNLQYLSPNAPINNWSEDYRGLIFYLLVYVPGDSTGIFPFPRFYGFSREPGMYVTFVLPGFFMACILRMKFQAAILAISVLITSSFAGYFVFFVGVFLMYLPKILYERALIILITLIGLLVIFRHNLASIVNVTRVNDYVLIMDRIINMYLYNAGKFGVSNILFILEKISYFIIIYNFYIKVKIINIRLVFVFLISFVILVNKANELISPLFLFYLLFIDYIYQQVALSNDMKSNQNPS